MAVPYAPTAIDEDTGAQLSWSHRYQAHVRPALAVGKISLARSCWSVSLRVVDTFTDHLSFMLHVYTLC